MQIVGEREITWETNSPLGRDIWLVRPNAKNEHSMLQTLQEAKQIFFDSRRKPVQSRLKGSNRKQTFGRPFSLARHCTTLFSLQGSHLHQQKAINSNLWTCAQEKGKPAMEKGKSPSFAQPTTPTLDGIGWLPRKRLLQVQLLSDAARYVQS